MMDLQTCWEQVKSQLQREISPVSFNTWFKDLIPIHLTETEIIFSAENAFIREQLVSKYYSLLTNSVLEVLKIPKINVIITLDNETTLATPTIIKPERNNWDCNLKSDYIFENFVIGSSNKMAHAAAVAVAENPGNSYNPLFLYGDSGLGKTHLMHAIAHYILDKNPSAKVLYTSCEQFTNEVISSIKANAPEEVGQKYRTVDVLLIDDIQFITNQEKTQEEFFHTFNALTNLEKQIIISSDRPPAEIQTLTDRLRSRFSSGLIADIKPPDFETRIAIIEKKSENLGISVPKEVSQFIAQSIKSNIRDLEGALTRVLAYVKLTNQPLSVNLAEDALKDIIANKTTYQLNVEAVKQTVANYYNINVEDINGRRRTKDIATARQVAMYICRVVLHETFESIGASFGRDYTTVISNTNVIQTKMNSNPVYNKEISNLINRIKQK